MVVEEVKDIDANEVREERHGPLLGLFEPGERIGGGGSGDVRELGCEEGKESDPEHEGTGSDQGLEHGGEREGEREEEGVHVGGYGI